jgi:polar amino acid transport system substrate-binding protein
MRVGINYGNTVLAERGKYGLPLGIAAELAEELARQLGTPLDWITYEAAGAMADGARANAWDVAFLAADPDRAREITFTPPYLEIDSTYLVPGNSSFETPSDVDRSGVRIAVSRNSAYDLFLTRNIKHAELVRAPNPGASADLFFVGQVAALAGIRPMLLDVARSRPGTRVLKGRFTTVQQAIGTPAGRDAAATYLSEFVEKIKASGLVGRLIERNQVLGVSALR